MDDSNSITSPTGCCKSCPIRPMPASFESAWSEGLPKKNDAGVDNIWKGGSQRFSIHVTAGIIGCLQHTSLDRNATKTSFGNDDAAAGLILLGENAYDTMGGAGDTVLNATTTATRAKDMMMGLQITATN